MQSGMLPILGLNELAVIGILTNFTSLKHASIEGNG
jgi:hypothetical protein